MTAIFHSSTLASGGRFAHPAEKWTTPDRGG